MVSPIPISIKSKNPTSERAHQPPKQLGLGSPNCTQRCQSRLPPLDTRTNSSNAIGYTPPISPISTRATNVGDPSARDGCICNVENEGYHQMEFTPPRSPPKMGSIGATGLPLTSRALSSGYASCSSFTSSGYSTSAYTLGGSGASSTTSLLSFPKEVLSKDHEIHTIDSSATATQTSVEESIATTLSKPLLLPQPYSPSGEWTIKTGYQIFGTGAWSTVRPATYSPNGTNVSKIIAVKLPNSSGSIPILHHEASILSYLTPSRHTISLLGYDLEKSAILLPALPLTMEEHVKRCSKKINSEEEISLATMRCPVVRMRQWLFWAQELTAGFIELKEKGVVHGDIKWGNILLEEVTLPFSDPSEQKIWFPPSKKPLPTLYRPVIVDFSSSLVIGRPVPAHPSYIPPNKKAQDEAEKGISALTVPFCAPELLEKFVAKSPETAPPPIPTFASDLYSLALTILTAAIGSDPYTVQKGVSDARKAMYVQCGDPIGFARGDERGLRCSKGGVVEEVLEGCFGKDAVGRADVETVQGRVKEVIARWVDEEAWDDSRWGTC
ncbi:kinase-like domain-containing protein [Peziza echinospora]|nr:kinase-like domain-containing protein [Peziza echinospora]